MKPIKNQTWVTLFGAFSVSKIQLGPCLALLGGFLAVVTIAVGSSSVKNRLVNSFSDFEPGKVADRDVVASHPVSYIDEAATKLRREAAEALVPLVFVFSPEIGSESLAHFRAFRETVEESLSEALELADFIQRLQYEFGGFFDRDTLSSLYRSPGLARIFEGLDAILSQVFDDGIWVFPEDDLAMQTATIELLRPVNNTVTSEIFHQQQLTTLAELPARIISLASNGQYPSSLRIIAPELLKPFASENIFFSPLDTKKRRQTAADRTEPVLKHIELGEKLIKKGFVVTPEDLPRLEALGAAESSGGFRRGLSLVLLLALVTTMLVILMAKQLAPERLTAAKIYVLVIAAVLYQSLVAMVDIFFSTGSNLIAIYVPTALFAVACAVLMGTKTATTFVLGLSLIAFTSTAYDGASFLYSFLAGIFSAFILRQIEKRIDLLKAGVFIAVFQIILAALLLLNQAAPGAVYPSTIFWAAANGIVGTTLALGLLPLMEQALNSATTFRLIELSDLNSPLLKRLLTAAPGTYSHSVMVANLAESACRDIGANALLARVGAYYHDIGKIDQPEYFIENQAAYNKHEELAPRLSVTVIRSHVKLGLEKARSLRLPQEVIDIIAEHHGNSLISWFYNEAIKRGEQVKPDEFSYPGKPPQSRESAVVLLADSVEAAVRTMKKPTMTKIDKFIHEIIMAKFSQGQLNESELTFKDLETIKKAFVHVLSGYYHSRIEYPKTKEPST